MEFGLIFISAVLSGSVGMLVGLGHGPEYYGWRGFAERMGVTDLRRFVTVAYIHNGGYLGALCGLLTAIAYLWFAARRAGSSVVL